MCRVQSPESVCECVSLRRPSPGLRGLQTCFAGGPGTWRARSLPALGPLVSSPGRDGLRIVRTVTSTFLSLQTRTKHLMPWQQAKKAHTNENAGSTRSPCPKQRSTVSDTHSCPMTFHLNHDLRQQTDLVYNALLMQRLVIGIKGTTSAWMKSYSPDGLLDE